MSNAEQAEAITGILTSAIIAGAWWYAAIRLSRTWLLWALAIVATLGTLLIAATVYITSRNSSLSGLTILLRVQPLLGVVDAALYVAFACWLVKQCQSNHNA